MLVELYHRLLKKAQNRQVLRNALPVVTRDAMCNWMATPARELVRVKSLLAS